MNFALMAANKTEVVVVAQGGAKVWMALKQPAAWAGATDAAGFAEGQGELRVGDRNGEVVAVYRGRMVAGRLKGEVEAIYPKSKDRASYRGEMFDWSENGKGTMTMRNGTRISGIWKDGELVQKFANQTQPQPSQPARPANAAGMDPGNRILSFEDAKQLADQGNTYAEAIVAFHYSIGWGVEKNAALAVKYALSSAQKGHPLGLFRLGAILRSGEGVPQDEAQGLQLQKQSIQGLNKMSGNPYAISAIGVMLWQGKALAENKMEAARLYKMAADMGFAPAQFNYALAAGDGLGTAKSPQQKDAYLRMAAAAQYPLAMSAVEQSVLETQVLASDGLNKPNSNQVFNTYDGTLGEESAQCTLRWIDGKNVQGALKTATADFKLEGDNHIDGQLAFEMYQGEGFGVKTGKLVLKKSAANGSIIWSGTAEFLAGKRVAVSLRKVDSLPLASPTTFRSSAAILAAGVQLINQKLPEKPTAGCVNARATKFALIENSSVYIYELPSGRLLELLSNLRGAESISHIFFWNDTLHGVKNQEIVAIDAPNQALVVHCRLPDKLTFHAFSETLGAILCRSADAQQAFLFDVKSCRVTSLAWPMGGQSSTYEFAIFDSDANIIVLRVNAEDFYQGVDSFIKISPQGKLLSKGLSSSNGFEEKLRTALQLPKFVACKGSDEEAGSENRFNFLNSLRYGIAQAGVCFKPSGEDNLFINFAPKEKLFSFHADKGQLADLNFVEANSLTGEIAAWGIQPFIGRGLSPSFKLNLNTLQWCRLKFDGGVSPIALKALPGIDGWTCVVGKQIEKLSYFEKQVPIKCALAPVKDGYVHTSTFGFNILPWESGESQYYSNSMAVAQARHEIERTFGRDKRDWRFEVKERFHNGESLVGETVREATIYDLEISDSNKWKWKKQYSWSEEPIGVYKIGQYYIVGTRSSISVLDDKSGNVIFKWVVPAGSVPNENLAQERISVNERRREVYYIGNRGELILLKLSHVGELKVACRIETTAVGAPLFVSDNNMYCSFSKVITGLHFSNGQRTFPFEQFDLRLNRPDVILERLGSPLEAVAIAKELREKRLKRMGVTEEMLKPDFHLPEVELVGDIPLSTGSDEVEVRVKASDSKYPLDRLRVYVNNVPVNGKEGEFLRDSKSQSLERTMRIKLAAGRNKIQVSVLNSAGAESFYANAEVTCTAQRQKPTLYAVAMGVSEYANPDWSLKYAAKDARDVVERIRTRAGASHGKVKELLLTDREVTKESLGKIREFLKEATIDDTVVMFLAGHGLLDDKYDYYFGTSDIDFANPSGKGIAFEEFDDLLAELPCLRKSLLVDTCHAGELDEEEKRMLTSAKANPNQLVAMLPAGARGMAVKPVEGARGKSEWYERLQGLFVDLRRGSGSTILSSSAGAEYALESSQQKNGIFTYAVLEALDGKHGADANNDGMVKMSELGEYVRKRVAELTNNKQTPNLRRVNLEGDFVLRN